MNVRLAFLLLPLLFLLGACQRSDRREALSASAAESLANAQQWPRPSQQDSMTFQQSAPPRHGAPTSDTWYRHDRVLDATSRADSCAVAPSVPVPDRVFTPARADNPFAPKSFCIIIGAQRYSVTADGQGTRVRQGQSAEQFALRHDTNGSVSELQVAKYRGMLLFMYFGDAGGEGFGYLEAFADATLHRLWRAPPLLSFNLGPVLLDSLSAFIPGADMIARVDLTSGQYRWCRLVQHSEPAQQRHFHAFDLPVLDHHTLVVVERARLVGPPVTLALRAHDGHLLLPQVGVDVERCPWERVPN